MMAPSQACAGLALAAGLAMLCTRQLRTAVLCFAAQSAAAATAAILAQQPLLAAAPAATLAALQLLRLRTPAPPPADGLAAGLAAGVTLALLCLSSGEAGLPLAVVMLSVVLAATRADALTKLVALGAMANGIVLIGCLIPGNALLPLACLALPVPLAAGLLDTRHFRLPHPAQPEPAPRLGRAELAAASALFVATLTVPLGALASVFAPLIAFDGIVRAWIERTTGAISPARRLASLLQLVCILLAITINEPMLAWLGVVGAVAAGLPNQARADRTTNQARADRTTNQARADRTTLACIGAGLALFGLLTLPAEPSLPGYLALFAGFAVLAAAVPDLAIPLLAILLRSASKTEWLPQAGPLGTGVALIALLTCSALLIRRGRHRARMLVLAQASIAALAIATLQPDGRLAAAVLLILLSLTRTASRATGQPTAALAVAGLSGLPPLGVFPGLVLVVLAVSSHAPWLLLPLGLALPPILLAGVPPPLSRLRAIITPREALLSAGWLPLALAALFGLAAPADLVRWLAAVTMGPS
jgi:hypothetical protein